MRIIFYFLFSILTVLSNAGEIKYPVSQVPAELLKDANVVCRVEEETYQVHSLREASFKRKIVLTILNDKGDRYSSMVINYSSLINVTNFEGALYDADGQLIKRLKSKDILDRSYVSDISLMEDTRLKEHDFDHKVYPYTVEYETEQKFYSTYFIPDWTPQMRENYSVQKSSYTFIAPGDYTVRYKALNYKNKPVEGMLGNNKSYSWEINNLPVIVKPFASPKWSEISPNVQFAPSRFEMSGYQGTAESWEEFGKFSWTLNEGRDVLPPAIENKVKELTAGLTNDKEKVKVLYEFLQKNTRYISIQLGIGGYQPFEAKYVAQNGYGDCKALSNYMFSLLKAAGIKSHYSLIYGGSDMSRYWLFEDFPANYFNHIVLCVPLLKDSMWLECTSQTEAAGYMGGFTGNRKALLITNNGGKLVSTPRYGAKENVIIRNVQGSVSATGKLDLKVKAIYRNMEQERLNSLLTHGTKEKIMEFLQEEYDDMGTYTVNSYHHEIKKDVFPEIDEQLDISAFTYASISGKRMFIVPNVMNRQGMRLTVDSSRKFDFVFDAEYKNEDIVTIEIPEGYQLESPYKDINIQSKFGNYSATARVEGKNIIFRRVREQNSGRYSPREGGEIAKYYNEIYKADRAKMVFVKVVQ